jgi:hypothetical protein
MIFLTIQPGFATAPRFATDPFFNICVRDEKEERAKSA